MTLPDSTTLIAYYNNKVNFSSIASSTSEFWSSSDSNANKGYSKVFSNGDAGYSTKTNRYHVLCVGN